MSNRKRWLKKDYLNQKDDLMKYVKLNGILSVTEFSDSTGLPLIVAYELVRDDFKDHKEFCDTKIKELIEFYKL